MNRKQYHRQYPWLQYIPRNMHTVFALLCFVVVIHWLIFPYPSGLLHWHCGNLTIAPVPAKQPWWIWINTSCEFIMNDCITTTKQSTTKPCAYFLGYTVLPTTFISKMLWNFIVQFSMNWCHPQVCYLNWNLWMKCRLLDTKHAASISLNNCVIFFTTGSCSIWNAFMHNITSQLNIRFTA